MTPQADAFFNVYHAVYVMFCEKIIGVEHPLKPKHERLCRFCGRGSADVTFKKQAHRISQSLGNSYLLSDFECDQCNSIFGNYENDLTTYFLPYLALQGIRGQEGKRKFKSNRIRISPFEFEGIEMMRISRKDTADSSLIADHNTGKNAINFSKGTYIPLRVYKAFLKMALSCISDEDSQEYSILIKLILTDDFDGGLKQFAKISIHAMPISFGHQPPVAFVYRKKQPESKVPTHVFVLRFANLYVQFFLPLNSRDIRDFYNDGTFDLFICPPIFAEPTAFCPPEYWSLDLSSVKSVKAEEHGFRYGTDPDILKNHGVVLDPETGDERPIEDFGEVQQVLFVPKGTELSIEAVRRLTDKLKLEKK